MAPRGRPRKNPLEGGNLVEGIKESTAQNGTNQTERLDRMMLTLQGMESVVAQREREIDDLNYKRSNLVGQISDLERELERKKAEVNVELSRRNQKFEDSIAERMNILNHKERVAERLAQQLDQREKAVLDFEKRYDSLREKERELNDKAISIERLRIQYQLEYDRSAQIRSELDGIKAENELARSTNKQKEFELRERQDKLYALEADADGRLKALIVREQAVKAISDGMAPKFLELEAKEQKISKDLQVVGEKLEEINRLNGQTKEVESILDRKQKEMDQRMDFITQQEAIQKQKKMELIAWEDRLRMQEKKKDK